MISLYGITTRKIYCRLNRLHGYVSPRRTFIQRRTERMDITWCPSRILRGIPTLQYLPCRLTLNYTYYSTFLRIYSLKKILLWHQVLFFIDNHECKTCLYRHRQYFERWPTFPICIKYRSFQQQQILGIVLSLYCQSEYFAQLWMSVLKKRVFLSLLELLPMWTKSLEVSNYLLHFKRA